jgi:iron-sulfur cluster assembly accessory protein
MARLPYMLTGPIGSRASLGLIVLQADEVIEQDGARVLIAPMAQMFLFGTEIDYRTQLLESGFVFNNPNATKSCGCGSSFSA